MKYVKLTLGIIAVILAALALMLVVRLTRDLMMGGASLLSAMGDMPVEMAQEPAPTLPPAPVLPEDGEETVQGGLDGNLLPEESYGNVVYDTEGLDLFEVPVESLAEDLPLYTLPPEE